MRILAIETSCDETSVSILEIKGGLKNPRFCILSNVVASQVKIHAPWGGVVPNLAKREHQKNLVPVLKQALKEAKMLKNSKSEARNPKQIINYKFKILNSILEREPELLRKLVPFLKKYRAPGIDLIGVTNGPGLEPALWVGVNFAKALALAWQKSVIAINHMEGHLFSVFLKNREEFSISPSSPRLRRANNFQFPIVALLVSGGHTQLVLIENWLKYELLGETLDDAAGEAFDKVAKMLKLGYPGGPVIAAEAAKFKVQSPASPVGGSKFKVKLPRPMINSKDYNFSFSGLKTAVLYKLKELEAIPYDREELVSAMAAEFQQAVIDVLISKTMRAAKEYRVKTVILGGGVAANKELRRQLQECTNKCDSRYLYNLLMPEMAFTGDNAAMIALAAYFRWTKNKKSANLRTLRADGSLKLL